MKRSTIEEKLAALDAKRAELTKELDASKGRTLIACESSCYGRGCGKKFQIRNLTYIQTFWYTSPYGCTGGDYWNQGDGEFDCPACGLRNRLYNREHYRELREHFKDIVTSHDKADGRPGKIDERVYW